MMEDINEDIKNLRVRLDEASRYLRIPELLKRREQLEEEMADPNLWDDQNRGREVQKNLSEVDGYRDDLPGPADAPKQFGLGIKRESPRHY